MVKLRCTSLFLTSTMLEHQLPFLTGEYSLNTTSFGFSGINSKWVSSWPQSSNSTHQPVKSPVKLAVVRPSALDDKMIMINNAPPSFKAKNKSHVVVPQPKSAPTIGYIEDPQIEIDAGPIGVPVPSIKVNERDDDDDIFEMANAERDFALSSPVKWKASSVDVSIDLFNWFLTHLFSAE